jgi:hypothetical protein
MKLSSLVPLLSLIVVALLCGLIWRLEVDHHGWEGLKWLSYFHVAIPAAFGLFLIWSNLFVRLPWHRRLIINSIAIIYGFLIYYFLVSSLVYQFNTGPSALFMRMSTPYWKHILYQNLSFVLIPFLPLGTFLILRLFGKKVPVPALITAIVCIIFSGAVAEMLLLLVQHRGGHDYIHAIKSGFLIPFWVFSIGLIIVGHAHHKISQVTASEK